MSDKAAGWYPDPDGESRQRFWDGDSWTEYYTPLAPEQSQRHGAATATADYPYLSGAGHADLMATPVQVGGQRGGWPTTGSARTDGETLEFSGKGRRSSASMWALVAASVLVVMLVAGVGWWAFGPDPAPIDDPTASDTTAPTDGETITGELGLDAAVSARVPEGGLWIGTLTIDAARTVIVDAQGSGSRDDVRVTIVPEGSDDAVAGNDDRGTNLATLGDSALNPLAVAALEPGTYEVRVDERNGAEVDFDILVSTVSESLTPGSTVDFQIPDGGYWAGELSVTAGTYTIDVEGLSNSDNTNPDAVLVIIGTSDRQYYNDDRTADDRDPQLTQDLAEGTWVAIVFDYRGRALLGTATLTAQS